MALHALLSSARSELVDAALVDLHELELHHYEGAGHAFTKQRFEGLFDLVLAAIDNRELAAVIQYAEGVAEERFDAGFDLFEVQTAFNTLEALMWQHLVAKSDPAELVESIGLVGTVFGTAKDALARKYVSLATHRHVPTLDLSALFRGASSGVHPYEPG
jgi:uncharacterized protein (DUF952 family)